MIDLSAQQDNGGEAGRAPPPSEDPAPRGSGHHGAAVKRHLPIPARHELLIVQESQIAQVK